jgi:hypothetical protein
MTYQRTAHYSSQAVIKQCCTQQFLQRHLAGYLALDAWPYMEVASLARIVNVLFYQQLKAMHDS